VQPFDFRAAIFKVGFPFQVMPVGVPSLLMPIISGIVIAHFATPRANQLFGDQTDAESQIGGASQLVRSDQVRGDKHKVACARFSDTILVRGHKGNVMQGTPAPPPVFLRDRAVPTQTTCTSPQLPICRKSR